MEAHRVHPWLTPTLKGIVVWDTIVVKLVKRDVTAIEMVTVRHAQYAFPLSTTENVR